MGIGLIIERFLIWPIFGQLRSGVNILCQNPPATSAAGASRRRRDAPKGRSVRSTDSAKRQRRSVRSTEGTLGGLLQRRIVNWF